MDDLLKEYEEFLKTEMDKIVKDSNLTTDEKEEETNEMKK